MSHDAAMLRLINQLFEASRKAARAEALQPLQKHLERMAAAIGDMGYRIADPSGEPYNELRTDCECSIAGDADRPLFITEVLKPAVYREDAPGRDLLQKAVVIAGNRRDEDA